MQTFKSGLSKKTRSVAGSFSGWPLGFSHQVKILWRTSHSSRFLCSDYILMTCWESCLISLYSNLYCSAIPQELGECRFHLETGEDSQSWTKEVPSSSGWQLSWRWWWWRWWRLNGDWSARMLHFCYICYIFAAHFLLSLLLPDQSNSHWTPSFPQSIKTRIRNNFQRNLEWSKLAAQM